MNIIRWCCDFSEIESPVNKEETTQIPNPITTITVVSIASQVMQSENLPVQHVKWDNIESPLGSKTFFSPTTPGVSPLSFPVNRSEIDEKYFESTEEDDDYTLSFVSSLTKDQREVKAQLYWERYRARQKEKIQRILDSQKYHPNESFLPEEGEPGNKLD